VFENKQTRNRPVSDAALQNLKKSRRVSIAGGDRKKGVFDLLAMP